MKNMVAFYLIILMILLYNLTFDAMAAKDSNAWVSEERSLFLKQLTQENLNIAVTNALRDGAEPGEIIAEASKAEYKYPLKVLQAIVIAVFKTSKGWTSEEQFVFKELLKMNNLVKAAKIALQGHGAPVAEIMILYLDEGGKEPADMLLAIYSNGGDVNNIRPRSCEILRRSHLIDHKDNQVLMVYFKSEGLLKNIKTCASKSGILACNMVKAAKASNYDPYLVLKELLEPYKNTRRSNEMAGALENLFACLKKEQIKEAVYLKAAMDAGLPQDIIEDIIGSDYLSGNKESGTLGGSIGAGIISPSRP